MDDAIGESLCGSCSPFKSPAQRSTAQGLKRSTAYASGFRENAEKETEQLLAAYRNGEIPDVEIAWPDTLPLPATASALERRAYEFYRLVRGLYNWARYGGALMLGVDWTAAQPEVRAPSGRTMHRALVALRDEYGVLEHDKVRLKNGRVVFVYAHAESAVDNVVNLRRAA